ncbi:MAG TPA: acyltransferase [Gemmatimonadaceae bacterium]|nr:acyltransferase [Gemmatimonadaceae bacterium]
MQSLSKTRIGALDGLRAVSILLVVIGHVAGTRGFPLQENRFAASLALFGVRVFFVISGFLITRILFEEAANTGGVSLGRFYFRRTLRIFVPYYVFLLTMFLLDRSGIVLFTSGDLGAAATYTSNYRPHLPWQLAHTWSLSVEEQFYLLWPAALVFLGRRRGLILVALAMIAVPLIRIATWRFAPALHEGIGHRFETCADSLATGCLLAGVRDWLGARRLYARYATASVALGVAVLALGTIVFDSHPQIAFAFGWSMQNIAIAFIIDVCLRDARGAWSWLSSAPATALGRMSYSIYLWQQLFLDRQSNAAMCRFPINLFAVAGISALSYYAIEKGSLALRQRLEGRLFSRNASRLAPVGDVLGIDGA